MAEFRIPIRILYGNGTLEHISGLRGDRMLLVHDCEAACRIAQKQARHTGMHIRVFSVPEGPVDGPTVLEGAKALMEFKPGWIIAIGGHAAMDCAKLMRIFYERPDLTPDDLVRSDIPRMKLGRTRLIAVPTLGSNGGEATGYAALWNPRECLEQVIYCPGLMPHAAIIDPLLLNALPHTHTGEAVLSALALSVEAAVSPEGSFFSRPFAMQAMHTIISSTIAFSCLPFPSEPLLNAQILSGIAHYNASPGLCSAMVHGSTGLFGCVSFGTLCAVYLPAIIRRSTGQYSEGYAAIASELGLKDTPEALAALIEEYADMLGLPLKLCELERDKNAFLKKLPRLTARVAQCGEVAQIIPDDTQKKVEELFRHAYSK